MLAIKRTLPFAFDHHCDLYMYLLVLVAEVVESKQPKKVKNTAALQLMQLHCVAFALTTTRDPIPSPPRGKW